MSINNVTPIKIHVTENLYNKIYDEAKRFNIVKTNKEPSINKLINIVIANYHEDFFKKETKKLHIIEKQLEHIKNKFELKEIAAKIYESLLDNDSLNKECKNNRTISFKANKDTDEIIDDIKMNDLSSSITFTTCLRNMFSSFFKLPSFEREKIIYKKIYNEILTAIQHDLCIVITTKEDKKIRLKPYKVITNSEEIRNYLIGKEALDNSKKNYKIIPRRLDQITKVIIDWKNDSNNIITLSDKDIEVVNKMISNGVQFIYSGKEKITKVLFTENGYKAFQKTYLQKPKTISETKTDDKCYILEFNCSDFQLKNFLYKFGKDAKVIEPIKLANDFKKFYLEAYNNYNSNK